MRRLWIAYWAFLVIAVVAYGAAAVGILLGGE